MHLSPKISKNLQIIHAIVKCSKLLYPIMSKIPQWSLRISKNLQRSPKISKDLQRSPKISKVLQRSLEIYKDLQGSLKISKDLQRSQRISKDLQGWEVFLNRYMFPKRCVLKLDNFCKQDMFLNKICFLTRCVSKAASKKEEPKKFGIPKIKPVFFLIKGLLFSRVPQIFLALLSSKGL